MSEGTTQQLGTCCKNTVIHVGPHKQLKGRLDSCEYWQPLPSGEAGKPAPTPEREFLDASIAVWRELDAASATGTYQGEKLPIHDMQSDLRVREREAWLKYRACLDTEEEPPVVHKYAGWPGKSACGATGAITSIANEDVTCSECAKDHEEYVNRWRVERGERAPATEQETFTLGEISRTTLAAGIASPRWNALEKQLAKELLRYIAADPAQPVAIKSVEARLDDYENAVQAGEIEDSDAAKWAAQPAAPPRDANPQNAMMQSYALQSDLLRLTEIVLQYVRGCSAQLADTEARALAEKLGKELEER